MQPKRELTTYGKQIELKIGFREATGGSNTWGPWTEANGFEVGRKTFVGRQAVQWLIDHGFVTWGNMVRWGLLAHLEDFGRKNDGRRV